MISGRSAKHLQRTALVSRIEKSVAAKEMSPCDFCIRTKRRCVVSTSSSSLCSNCARYGKAGCNPKDKLPTVNDWASIDRQRKKLRDERKEIMAKLMRLTRMEEALEGREQKMLDVGVSTLEELDAKEAEERAAVAALEHSVTNLDEASAFLDDFIVDPEALSGLPVSFWDGISSSGLGSSSSVPSGVSNDTAAVDSGSSGSVSGVK